MFTTKITKLSRASLAGAVLLTAASLQLSARQARAESVNNQTPAPSLADLSPPGQQIISAEDKAYLNNMLSYHSPAFSRLSKPTRPPKVNAFDSKKRKSEKPPLNGGRIAGEFLAGTLLGVFWGGAMHNIFVVPFGCALGVWGVGKAGNETGPYWTALVGSALGTLSVILYVEAREDITSLGEGIFLLSLPAVCSTIAFNLTRRYDSPPASKTGLLNFRDGRLSFAVPTTYLRPNNFDRFRVTPSKKNSKHLDLVRVDF